MINTAVILAGREEKFFSCPVALIEFAPGMTLLNRTIQLLKKNGIKDIILVSGFRSDEFKTYTDLKQVKNENYKYTSSMASLALAEPYINGDFLLIESDVLFEECLISKLVETEKHTCLCIADESGNGDEAFVEMDGQRVLKISKDIHQFNRIDGEMIGVSKISLGVFKRMMIKFNENRNPKVNYEYILMDVTDKYEVSGYKFNNLVWCEVDNEEDFKNLSDYTYRRLCRKENPFDYQNIVDYLRVIFPDCNFENRIPVTQIGGMTNRNFKIALNGKDYVLRIPGNGTEGMVQRTNEEFNSMLSYEMGLNVPILYFNKENGIKLSQYVENAETLNSATIQRFDNLDKVIDIFKCLHSTKVRMNNDFNVFREIQNYERLANEAKADIYTEYYEYREKILFLSNYLNDLGVELCPCHNDIVAENFIKDRMGKIYLIDWEYSGMNDAMWDLAGLFQESSFSHENQIYALNRYFDGNIPEIAWRKILVYQILMDVLWSIWTVIKEKQGDEFGSYGYDRLHRAITNLNKLDLK